MWAPEWCLCLLKACGPRGPEAQDNDQNEILSSTNSPSTLDIEQQREGQLLVTGVTEELPEDVTSLLVSGGRPCQAVKREGGVILYRGSGGQGRKGLSGMGLHLVHGVTEPLWDIPLLDLCRVPAASPEPKAMQAQIGHCVDDQNQG